MVKGKKRHASCIGILVPLICLMIFGADNFMLPTMITILVLFALLRSKLENPEVSQHDPD